MSKRDEVLRLTGRTSDDIEAEYVDYQSYDNHGKLVDVVALESEIRTEFTEGLARLKDRMAEAKLQKEANLTRR